jgi:hypothetical protein
VSLSNSGIAAPGTHMTLSLDRSQSSVTYCAFARPLRDADFVFDGSAVGPRLTVSVAASPDSPAHDVVVRAPARPVPWKQQEGFTKIGEKKGNGSNLAIDLGVVAQDSVIVVQAYKSHAAVKHSSSALQLEGAAAALARPSSALGLYITPVPPPLGAPGSYVVSGGDRGVFYFLRPVGGANNDPAIVYFHRLDELDPQYNFGVGQLRVGVDFVIPRAPMPNFDPSPPSDLAVAHPPAPIVSLTLSPTNAPGGSSPDIAPGPVSAMVSVMAVRARTGVGWSTSRTIAVSLSPAGEVE